MKRTMKHLTLGLALFLANFASQAMAQSTPQQVKGINARGAKWQALTDQGQVAVTTNATTEYVAWKVNGSENIQYSTSTNGVTWTTPLAVGGTYQHRRGKRRPWASRRSRSITTPAMYGWHGRIPVPAISFTPPTTALRGRIARP